MMPKPDVFLKEEDEVLGPVEEEGDCWDCQGTQGQEAEDNMVGLSWYKIDKFVIDQFRFQWSHAHKAVENMLAFGPPLLMDCADDHALTLWWHQWDIASRSFTMMVSKNKSGDVWTLQKVDCVALLRRVSCVTYTRKLLSVVIIL